MIFLSVVSVTTGADYLEGFKCLTIHHHKVRRPVATHHSIFIGEIPLFAIIFTGFNRAGVIAGLHFSNFVWDFHPQINQRQFAIAPDGKHIPPGRRHARDVDGIAGIDIVDNFIRITVNNRHLARVAQGHSEKVLPIAIMLRRSWTIFWLYEHFPGRQHLLQRHFGRLRRLVLDKSCHQVGFFFC